MNGNRMIDDLEVFSVFKIMPNEEQIDIKVSKAPDYSGCKRIEYHQPGGEGDAHYCDVEHWYGGVTRIFRPDIIEFEDSQE